jgi:hypothetical protein
MHLPLEVIEVIVQYSDIIDLNSILRLNKTWLAAASNRLYRSITLKTAPIPYIQANISCKESPLPNSPTSSHQDLRKDTSWGEIAYETPSSDTLVANDSTLIRAYLLVRTLLENRPFENYTRFIRVFDFRIAVFLSQQFENNTERFEHLEPLRRIFGKQPVLPNNIHPSKLVQKLLYRLNSITHIIGLSDFVGGSISLEPLRFFHSRDSFSHDSIIGPSNSLSKEKNILPSHGINMKSSNTIQSLSLDALYTTSIEHCLHLPTDSVKELKLALHEDKVNIGRHNDQKLIKLRQSFEILTDIFSQQSHSLTSVKFKSTSNVAREDFDEDSQHLFEPMPFLSALSQNSLKTNGRSRPQIRKFSALTVLELENCGLVDLHPIKNFGHLKVLSLKTCFGTTDSLLCDVLPPLASTLESLTLKTTEATETCLIRFLTSMIKKGERNNTTTNFYSGLGPLFNTSENQAAIESNLKLKKLSLINAFSSPITSLAFTPLSFITTLQTLVVKDQAFQVLSLIKTIRCLAPSKVLNTISVSQPWFASMLVNDVMGTSISLHLGSSLVHLDLSESAVTNTSCAYFKKWLGMCQVIKIFYCLYVTADGLMDLAEISALKLLDVRRCPKIVMEDVQMALTTRAALKEKMSQDSNDTLYPNLVILL